MVPEDAMALLQAIQVHGKALVPQKTGTTTETMQQCIGFRIGLQSEFVRFSYLAHIVLSYEKYSYYARYQN
jgi:hypothetical protein